MVEIRRTGRTPHELVEIPPDVLDCGHPNRRGEVTVGFDEHPRLEVRVRTYRCRECGEITYTQPS